MKKLLTLLFILNCFTSKAINKYYFSTSSGDDNRTPLQAQNTATPWRTLAKLTAYFSSFLPGDSALLKRGETFYGSITISRSGTLSLPIVIGAYGTGAKPVITSLVSVVFSTPPTGNVYISDANSFLFPTLNVVLQNAALQPLGRYPNLSATNKGYLTLETHVDTTSITDNQLTTTPYNWAGAKGFIRRDQTNFEEGTIYTHVGGTLTFSPKLPKEPNNRVGYLFQKDPKTLDQNGEWYYKASTKQVYVYSSTGAPQNIQASTISNLVVSPTYSYVTFTGLELRGANEDAFNIGRPATAGPMGVGGTGIKIENCDILYSGGSGIYSSRHDIINVTGNTVSYSLTKGINLASSHRATVRNNTVTNTRPRVGMGSDFSGVSQGTGILAIGSIDTLEYNRVLNSGCFGIYADGDSVIIKNNVVDSFGVNSNDCGGIDVFGGAGERHGIQIIGNIVSNGPGAIEGGTNPTNKQTACIYVDAKSSNNLIQGNSASKAQWGIFLHNGDSNIVRDNTLYDNAVQLLLLSDRTDQFMRANIIKNNILFARTSLQLLTSLFTVNNDILQFGTFDSNYLCRPALEPAGINNAGTSASGGTFQIRAGVTSYYSADVMPVKYPPYELHSKKSSKGIDVLRYEENKSSRDSIVVLNYGNRKYTWLDPKAHRYKDTLTMKPFTSIILTRDTIVPLNVIPNEKPTVEITSPADGADYIAPASISFEADASDADGSITIVRWYNGSTLLGSDNTSPYTFTWSPVGVGGNSITAHATDNAGDSSISPPVSVTVHAANVPPIVSITSPADSSNFTTPANFTLQADASDPDSSIVFVDFYKDGVYIGRDSTAPYTFNVSGDITGVYNFYAKATDNSGAVTTSASITVNVNPLPPLQANVIASPILCFGGTTTLTIGYTGGVEPVTGPLGDHTVGPGTYTYILIDSVETHDTITVTVPPATEIILTDSIGTITTTGGYTQAVIYATGGTGVYQYQIANKAWQTSNVFTIQADNHTVNVRDSNGCTKSISFSVVQPVDNNNTQSKMRGRHVNINR